MMSDTHLRGVAQRPEQRSPTPRVGGSSPSIPAMNIKWAAVVAAVLLVGGLVLGGFAYFTETWDTFALAGTLELSGIGFALLNLNDKD